MIKASTFSLKTLKITALTGYFGLLFFMPLWLVVLNPSDGLTITLSLVFFTLPLLFPLKGLIQGNPYTFAWANFVVMIYFLHSLTTLWVSPEDTIWAIIELIFATLMFFGGTYYAKFKGQELGLSLRDKKPKKES